MSTGRIGIVTDNADSDFHAQVIAAAQKTAHQRGYTIDLFLVQPGDSIPFTPQNTVGILEIADAAPDDYLRALHAVGHPLALISDIIPDIDAPSVFSDNRAAFIETIDHLVRDCNRTRLLYLRGVPNQADSQQRDEGYLIGLMRHNITLDPTLMITCYFRPEEAEATVQRALDTGLRFDAIVCGDYQMALAALQVLANNGVRVPDDVAVTGYGDRPPRTTTCTPPLTTVAVDIPALGVRATNQLIGQIEGRHITGITLLGTRLIIRGSTVKDSY